MKKLLTTLSILFIATASYAQTYTVERVIDGDTIVITTPEGKSEEIQLIGINAPNVVFPEGVDRTLMDPTTESVDKADDWGVDLDTLDKMGQEATKFLFELLWFGKEMRIEYDIQKKDKYSRTLAYIFFKTQDEFKFDENIFTFKEAPSEIFLNATIIKAGYATPMTIPPNVKYADLFKELYEEAREQKRGLWAEKNDNQPRLTSSQAIEIAEKHWEADGRSLADKPEREAKYKSEEGTWTVSFDTPIKRPGSRFFIIVNDTTGEVDRIIPGK